MNDCNCKIKSSEKNLRQDAQQQQSMRQDAQQQQRVCVRMDKNNKEYASGYTTTKYASGYTRTTESMRQNAQQQRVCVRMHKNNREYASGCTTTRESMREDAQENDTGIHSLVLQPKMLPA